MSATFSRTLRSLGSDRSRFWIVDLIVGGIVVAWAAWFLLADVAVYEVSEKARLEVESAAHAIAAPVAGKIIQTQLTIGRTVRAGEVLLVLDSEAEHLAVTEKRTRRRTMDARLKALREEIETEDEALKVQRKARDLVQKESRAEVAKAEAQFKFAERQSETLTKLRGSNAASEMERLRAKADLEAGRAAVQGSLLTVIRLEQDRVVAESERKSRLAKLHREAVELESEAAIEEAAIRRLEHDIALRTIRAPVSGRIGEAIDYRAGSVIQAAEKLGSIVPLGEPRAVAWFSAAAVGRLRPNQPARLRLEGFPWTQYGTIPALVAEIGNEARAGLVRVELTLPRELDTSIPVEHGLPGSAEVEVERVSPALLVLRAAGQFLGAKRSSGVNGTARAEP